MKLISYWSPNQAECQLGLFQEDSYITLRWFSKNEKEEIDIGEAKPIKVWYQKKVDIYMYDYIYGFIDGWEAA